MFPLIVEDEMATEALAAAAKDAAVAAAGSLGETATCTGTQVLVDGEARAAFCAKVSGARDDQGWFDQWGVAQVSVADEMLFYEARSTTRYLTCAVRAPHLRPALRLRSFHGIRAIGA